jgi:hypothetical protein
MQKSVFAMRPWDNPLMVLACVIGFALQFAVTEVPFLIGAFGTSHLSGQEWLLLNVLAAFPLLVHVTEVSTLIRAYRRFRTIIRPITSGRYSCVCKHLPNTLPEATWLWIVVIFRTPFAKSHLRCFPFAHVVTSPHKYSQRILRMQAFDVPPVIFTWL